MNAIPYNVTADFKGDVLRLRIRWSGNMAIISTGFKIDRTDSRGRKQFEGLQCRHNTHHGPVRIPASTINAAIWELLDRIADAFRHFGTQGITPGKEQLRAFLFPEKSTPDVWKELTRFCIEGERERQWAMSTVKSVRSMGALLKAFRPSLTFADFSGEILKELTVWQQSHKVGNQKPEQKGYANNVIAKNNRVLRWFLRWAEKQGHVPPGTASEVPTELKAVKRPVVFLTRSELEKIEHAPLPEGSPLDRARDFFVFCAYTSLRYSDAVALRRDMIREGYVEIVQKKTAGTVRIKLNDHARRILDKYPGGASGLALPSMTTANLNIFIKRIGRMCGIDTPVTVSQYYGRERVDRTLPKWQLLSSHAARRTFVCLALSMGIPPAVVMKWTGHSDYSAMRPYIDIATETTDREMEKFNFSET